MMFGVVQLCGSLALGIETLHEVIIIRVLAGQHFDRDHAIEVQLPCFVDRRHRTGAEPFKDLVAGDLPLAALLFDFRTQPLDLLLGCDAFFDDDLCEAALIRRLVIPDGTGLQRYFTLFAQTEFDVFLRRQAAVHQQLAKQCI